MTTKLCLPALMFTLGAWLVVGSATAQASSRTQTAPPATASSSHPAAGGSVTFHADNGAIVTVKSKQAKHHQAGPPPAFADLDSNHDGKITPDEASAYPPLANDFIQADRNRNGSVSKAEYKHWTSQP